LHVYERAIVDGCSAANLGQAGTGLVEQARRDLEGEGFDPQAAHYDWTVQNACRDRYSARGAIDEVAGLLAKGLGDASLLRLEARFSIGRVELPARGAVPPPEPSAYRASPLGGPAGLPVFEHAALIGHLLEGPFVVDGGTFTWLIGDGWSLAVDALGDAVATKENG
jgi:acetophenone carboxylase